MFARRVSVLKRIRRHPARSLPVSRRRQHSIESTESLSVVLCNKGSHCVRDVCVRQVEASVRQPAIVVVVVSRPLLLLTRSQFPLLSPSSLALSHSFSPLRRELASTAHHSSARSFRRARRSPERVILVPELERQAPRRQSSADWEQQWGHDDAPSCAPAAARVVRRASQLVTTRWLVPVARAVDRRELCVRGPHDPRHPAADQARARL